MFFVVNICEITYHLEIEQLVCSTQHSAQILFNTDKTAVPPSVPRICRHLALPIVRRHVVSQAVSLL